jgi:peptide/nickel transport system permease protein
MLKYVIRRLAAMVLVLAALILVMLVLSQLSPISPGRVALGPQANSQAIAAYNHKIGYDAPLPVRFILYVRDLFQGDLGLSVRTQRPVAADVTSLWPATFELALTALTLAGLLGLSFGGLGTIKWRGAYPLRAAMTFMGSAPPFLLAFAFLVIFGQQLHWLPLSGRSSFADAPAGPTGLLTVDSLLAGRLDQCLDAVAHLILPALSIALLSAVAIGRVLRGSLQETLMSNYIRTARTKGLSEWTVVRKHALRNAAGPALSITGLQMGLMLSGVVVVEQIFGWPGLGTYVAQAIPSNDFPAVSAVTLVLGVAYVLINAAVDLVQAWADPRIASEA